MLAPSTNIIPKADFHKGRVVIVKRLKEFSSTAVSSTEMLSFIIQIRVSLFQALR